VTDIGVRCEEHVGEVFPPRCSRCEAMQLQAERSRAERDDEPWAIPDSSPDDWSDVAGLR